MTVREGMAVTIDGEVSLTLKRESEIQVMLSIGHVSSALKAELDRAHAIDRIRLRYQSRLAGEGLELFGG